MSILKQIKPFVLHSSLRSSKTGPNLFLFIVFQKLPSGAQLPTSEALQPENRVKNRYKDLYPCMYHLSCKMY